MGHTASDGKDKNQTPALDGASVTLRGSVEKIMPSSDNNRSEVVQIVIEGAESLYREIRILNLLRDADGGSVALQPGSEVEITIKVRAGT
jgi:hypothetical protein